VRGGEGGFAALKEREEIKAEDTARRERRKKDRQEREIEIEKGVKWNMK